ncbi:hypothetical protein F5Y17DRAFT_433335 [Xylariaceae sp. FL0594]|nr:hypothetical protein F5Y17DRAFT_433335 [Xylariaceae sp. FL0594]
MVQQSSRSRLPIFAIFSVAIVFFLYLTTSPRTASPSARIDNEMSPAASDPIVSALKVSVSQASQDPPKLTIGVTNTNPEQPVTVFIWDSPLDSIAVQLGLVSFTPEGQTEPVDIPTIQVRRLMPPKEDAFVTIEPGATEEREVLLREPVVPLDKLKGKGEVTVVVKGEWRGVWAGKKGDISLQTLRNGDDSLKGGFESEPAVMEF